jgi:hypothetical protein
MAKIIQVIDVNSEGHTFRLSDGSMVSAPHGGEHYSIGDEWGKAPEPQGQPMTVEQAESPAQVEANLISEVVKPQSKRKAKKTKPRDATAEEQEASDAAADKKEAEAE